jgi:hypothetical protein
MDTSVSLASASFWGEHSGDHSGYSVSGAGDVNGDGYEDILIGSYLILGKASGWAMDTGLSSASAYFRGKGNDCGGSSVAGAGDVNGDGYDDILIGAYGDEGHGSNSGQTYLVFGKVSGWLMDMNLSLASASFLGEDAGFSNVGGDGNNFIGLSAGLFNESGRNNNFIGTQAGYTNSSGVMNNFIGYQTGYSNTTGGFNVAVGKEAGYSNSTGSNNLFLGSFAGRYETGSDAFYVDDRDRETTAGDKANALIYGIFADTPAGQSITFNVGTASFGTSTLGAGAITGTSFIIGANTLNATEWAFLDGQDQSVFTTSSPSFKNLTVSNGTGNSIYINPSNSAYTNSGLVVQGSWTSTADYQTLIQALTQTGVEIFAVRLRGSDQNYNMRVPTLSTISARDANGLAVLTSTNTAQFSCYKGIFLSNSYAGAGANFGEIRTGGYNLTFSPNNVLALTLDQAGNAIVVGDMKAATYHVGADAGIDATVTYVDTLLGAKTLTFKKGILTAQA